MFSSSFLATFHVHVIVCRGRLLHKCILVIVPGIFARPCLVETSCIIYSSRFDPQTGLLTGTNDGTLVNFFLRTLGRKSEKALCVYLLVFQVSPPCLHLFFPILFYASHVKLVFSFFGQALACCFCFFLRYLLAGWYK